MAGIKKDLLLKLVVLLCLLGFAMMDDSTDPPSSDNDEISKETVLSEFFGREGFKVNVSDQNLVKRYSSDVISRMSHLLDVVSGEEQNDESPIDINAAINTMIYMNEVNSFYSKKEKATKDQYEALLRAIDLIVPDSSTGPVYKLAKKELADFYIKQKDVSKELLERISVMLVDELLTTGDAARMLRHFYYHWIPLGDLAQLIETYAQ